MPCSRGSSQPREQAPISAVSYIARQTLSPAPPGKPHIAGNKVLKYHTFQLKYHTFSVLACMISQFSHVRLFATLWTVDFQVLYPQDSPGKTTEVACHVVLQGIFPIQGLSPHLICPPLAGEFFTTSATWEATFYLSSCVKYRGSIGWKSEKLGLNFHSTIS